MTATAIRPAKRRGRAALIIIFGAVLAFLIVIIAVVASTGGGSNTPATRPGEQAVYDGITAATDCASLATLFQAHSTAHDRFIAAGDTDSAAVQTAYMDAVADRQTQLGCQ